MRDRPAGLEHQPRRTLQQLLGVLPRSCHPRRLSFPADETAAQSLRQTQPGSTLPTRSARSPPAHQPRAPHRKNPASRANRPMTPTAT
jgi:hypothetical protein